MSTSENTLAGPSKVLLAAPRGYCAGVDRAVQTVEHALDLYGEPIYVRKEIVHNKHVVHELEKRGAIFVEQETEVPEGEMVVFSAHGVAPSVHENAAKRKLRTIDATCPLVTKVHVEARKFAADGLHDRPDRPRGPRGGRGDDRRGPERTVLVQTESDVDDLEVDDPEPDRLHHPDHALRRRDQLDHRPAEGEVPQRGRAQDRRHLLRDDQPPAGRQGAGEGVRPGAGDRLDQLIELEPPRRGGTGAWRRLVPDRQSSPGRRGLAGRRRDGRHHLRGQRPRGAGRAAGRLLPRARRRRRLRAEDRRTRTSASCSPARSARSSPPGSRASPRARTEANRRAGPGRASSTMAWRSVRSCSRQLLEARDG